MTDAAFADPRLAALYDPLDPDRSDLLPYLEIADECCARRVLDIGCGTGVFALLLADAGHEVVGLEPALAALDVARAKPGADRVRWVSGDARALPPVDVELVTMTANVAQAIVDPSDWAATLSVARESLVLGGYLVFETRVPARQAWREWTREATHAVTDLDGIGRVTTWCDVVDVSLPLVSFEWTYAFQDGTTLTSNSTLRFRERDEVTADLLLHGFVVDGVRDAPDRPGREYVFVARRS